MERRLNTSKESVIQSRIIKYLEAQGAFVINPKTTTYSRKGMPDLAVCFHGIFIALEIKRPGKTPTELQLLKLERVRQAGGIAIYTDNLEDVKELINDISTIQCPNQFNR